MTPTRPEAATRVHVLLALLLAACLLVFPAAVSADPGKSGGSASSSGKGGGDDKDDSGDDPAKPDKKVACGDDEDDEDGDDDLEAGAEARERDAELVERVTDSRPEDDDLAEMTAYAMAATVELPLQAKQRLLELRSESERLHAVGDLLGTAMKRLDYVERASERARSNGKVRFG